MKTIMTIIRTGIKRIERIGPALLAPALFATVVLVGDIFVCDIKEARANGNISADAPVPEQSIKREVRRAPIKRPAAKRPPAKKPAPPPKPPQPSSLERGISLMEQERYTQARSWLQKAVQEERRNPWAWYWYGKAHECMGKLEQAQFFYTRALNLDPALPPLSRVVAWPEEGDRKALWDPLRPARVYPVPTNDHGVVIVPPDSPQATTRPGRPAADPDMADVPVYVPPEPSWTEPAWTASPADAEQPPVYVPPTAEQQSKRLNQQEAEIRE